MSGTLPVGAFAWSQRWAFDDQKDDKPQDPLHTKPDASPHSSASLTSASTVGNVTKLTATQSPNAALALMSGGVSRQQSQPQQQPLSPADQAKQAEEAAAAALDATLPHARPKPAAPSRYFHPATLHQQSVYEVDYIDPAVRMGKETSVVASPNSKADSHNNNKNTQQQQQNKKKIQLNEHRQNYQQEKLAVIYGKHNSLLQPTIAHNSSTITSLGSTEGSGVKLRSESQSAYNLESLSDTPEMKAKFEEMQLAQKQQPVIKPQPTTKASSNRF